MITFAVFMAEASVTGYAKRYLEHTYHVAIFSYPPRGGRFGNKSIYIASSGPKSHSGRLIISGVRDECGILLSFIQISHP